MIVATLVWPAFVLGPARGPFIALALLSVGALGMVAAMAVGIRAFARGAPE